MKVRYQVFVSSTFTDLKVERQEVMTALLRLRCIPAGMEFFNAASRPPWDVIQKIIDDTDYYVLIVGGRYGSIADETDLSYTEMEYDYAREKGIPVLAFLPREPRKITLEKTDEDAGKAAKLALFVEKVSKNTTLSHWNTPQDLATNVALSIAQIKEDEPRPGWVRGDNALSQEILKEIFELREKVKKQEESQKSDPQKDWESLSPLAQWLLRKIINDDCRYLELNQSISGGRLVLRFNHSPTFLIVGDTPKAVAIVSEAVAQLLELCFVTYTNNDQTAVRPSLRAFSLNISPHDPREHYSGDGIRCEV